MHNENPFESPQIKKATFDEHGTWQVYWICTIFLVVGCFVLGWLAPVLAMVVGLLIVLPGLINSYVDYRRRLLAGPSDALDQWGTMVVAFLKLIPCGGLGVLAMFVIAEAIVAHARATMPDGVSAWDVMGGYMIGLIGGVLMYIAGVLAIVTWKFVRLNKFAQKAAAKSQLLKRAEHQAASRLGTGHQLLANRIAWRPKRRKLNWLRWQEDRSHRVFWKIIGTDLLDE